MKIKKIPYYLILLLLTSGASLILGFLSFGGMFALWPVLPLAFAAFVLSVAYEGEIYLQNIKGALNKLFKHNHLERQLSNTYLLEKFPDTTADDCPQFFKDYEAQLKLLHHFGHDLLDEKSAAQKKQVRKTLGDMEKWFARQLFASPAATLQGDSEYQSALRNWLSKNEQEKSWTDLNNRNATFKNVKLFSILSGLFMGTGTTYLLVEAFSAIPFFATIPFATWPLFILPMAAIAGTAYGLLTYNAVTDMIANDTLRNWYNKLKTDLSKDLTLRSVFMTITATVLVALALALTVCTAGTWWTVAKETRPLFTWMANMPGFIMGLINPIITGLSAIVFNLQNTSESLCMIDDATRKKDSFISRAAKTMQKGFSELLTRENWGQILNPFRLLLKLTIMPLRIVLFLGHLISIGVTADRVPGVSQVVSALLGIISEGFEDAHYFIGHDHAHNHEAECDETDENHQHSGCSEADEGHHHHHDNGQAHQVADQQARKLAHQQEMLQERLSAGHSHNHDLDLPTRIIKLVFTPVYLLATTWDYVASQWNKEPQHRLNFGDAWLIQTGEKGKQVNLPNNPNTPSTDWQTEQAVYRIERHKEKQLNGALIGADTAQKKIDLLTTLQQEIRLNGSKTIDARPAAEQATYGLHRFFSHGKTSTETFLEELPQRISAPSA